MIQAVLLLAALSSFLLGLFVFFNNKRSSLFRLYFLFTILSTGWIFVNALTIGGKFLTIHDTALLTVGRLITPLSLFSLLGFFYFLNLFMGRKNSRVRLLLMLPSIGIASLSFTNLNVYLQGGQLQLGSLYPYYLGVLLINVGLVVYLVLSSYTGKIATRGNAKLQMAYIRFGSIGTIVPALIFGAIVPVFNASDLSNLAPIFTLVFIVCAAIAMVKHQLFDVRAVVVRALGYVIALVAIASLYGFVVFTISEGLFNLNLPLGAKIFFAMATAVSGLAFQPTRKAFDRLTTRIFFQDAYVPQELFSELNKYLVSTLDLDKLLPGVASILTSHLKTSFSIIILRQISGSAYMIDDRKANISPEESAKIRKLASRHHDDIIAIDRLDDQKYPSLADALTQNNIVVLVRLNPKTHNEEGLGYLAFGAKKSGNAYTEQDLRVLGSVANELTVAIQNALHYEEIQNFNVTLQQRVVEATNKMRRTNEKLKALDETKDDFISMASHQLRTPLTSVKGYLSMVLEGDAGNINKVQREMLGQAFTSSQRMVYLIADLLNVSRLRTGKFVIEPSEVNLAEVVEQEMSQLTETAAAKQLTLTFTKPESFPALMLDETKTRQVIMNFMDNAIYYTPNGGHITIQLENRPSSVELKVVDDGMGVPKAEQHHLFTKFYRAGNARKARPDGTGLGLFMAKKVVVAQGGAIIFESQENKGSTFGFSFSKEGRHIAPTPVKA